METDIKEKHEYHYGVLKKGLGGGPHNLGDPYDKSLRIVEIDVMIPQLMKERAKKEKCPGEVEEFGICGKEQGLMMPFRCRKEAESLRICLTKSYDDPEFIRSCSRQYLQERTDYRATGIGKSKKRKETTI